MGIDTRYNNWDMSTVNFPGLLTFYFLVQIVLDCKWNQTQQQNSPQTKSF